MAYSSGTFSRLYDWTNDRDAGVKIRADRMDAEFDGIATALTTAVLKDGTQTTTATVPFAYGISVVDNQSVTLGTNSDYTVMYDETTRDSLMITSNVEGAVFSMVLAADQGDDAGDEWKIGIADGGVLTIGNDINSAHTYVAQLTLTPNSTVASSTTAVAGNLTVGGSLTLGSGAVISEAEMEMLDGITAGTVAASKAVVVDANKDAASFRNITLTGELDAGSLDISGDADIDGTTNLDAVDIDGNVQLDGTLTVGVDDTGKDVKFFGATSGKYMEWDESADQLDVTGSLDVTGNTSMVGTLTIGADDSGHDVIFYGDTASANMTWDTSADDLILSGAAGLVVPDGQLSLGSTAITATAAEINLIDGGTSRGTTAVASGDGILINDGGTMRMTNVDTVSTYFASHSVGGGNIVTTGALDSGSITSGFGAIDNGTSGIRTNTFTAETSIVPSASDGATLGTASLEWSDLYLADGGQILFGNDQDVTITHDPDDGLILKSTATADDNPFLLTLQTGETDLAANDVIGKIAFQAPDEGTGTDAILVSGAIQARAEGDHSSSSNATSLDFMTGASEAATTKMTITSGGDVGIGTTNAPGSNGGGLAVYDADYPRVYLRNSTTGDTAGNGAGIFMNSDDMYISNEDTDGVILFRTEATERMRIINSGFTKIYDASSSAISLTASYHHIAHANNDTQVLLTYAKHSSYASVVVQSTSLRAASTAHYLFAGNSDDGADSEFYVRGDGVVASDGANNLASGADYAEFFETTDGKAIAVGTTVVLENNKVRASKSSDSQSSVIGVVRPKSTGGNQVAKVGVVGNTACMRWMNKYLIDDYGAYIMEETTMTKWTSKVVNSVGGNEEREFIYETDKIPADGTDIWGAKNPPSDAVVYDTELSGELKGKKILRRKLNPDFDDSKEYVKREDRDEWVIVGLMGQVAITKGQKMGDRWIKMRDISDTVEEYMIR
tara:strand:+ start:930 stop:3809 length:2880 start_codon:yes stop_codon:yes gene_type:complete